MPSTIAIHDYFCSMKIQLIKNRSDIGAGTRGSDMGIDAMEIAAINRGDDFFHRQLHIDIESHNESIYRKNTNPFAKRIEQVFEQCERVAVAVAATIKENHFPIVLSGDHSSALGTISGIKAAHPDLTLGVVWLDAHADIHSPYTSPSGNIHGMPLAAVLGKDNLVQQLNPIEPATEYFWRKIKNIGVSGPKLSPEHLVYFGLRDFESAEQRLIETESILHYRVDEMRMKGMGSCVRESLERMKDCDLLYISFDVDSMDCDSISYGTGTPVPTGFYPTEVIEIIDQFMDSGKVICIEFTEINPLLDNKGNKMAETAFDVLAFIGEKVEKDFFSSTPFSVPGN